MPTDRLTKNDNKGWRSWFQQWACVTAIQSNYECQSNNLAKVESLSSGVKSSPNGY